MIVDIYTHVLPAELAAYFSRAGGAYAGLLKRLMSVRELHDFDARFRRMDEIEDYRQIIALGNPPLEVFMKPGEGAEVARISNDAMAELVRRHPDRFPAFVAGVPMQDMTATMDELKRAVESLGARGVQIYTNINGRPLDDPEYEPLFAAMESYDLPIWLHPCRTPETTDYASEKKSRFELWWCFGWPYETSLAMTRLVLTGLFDRHSNLKIITHHLGGMIPYYDKRIERGLAVLGSRTKDEDYSKVLSSLKRPFMDYFHLFYADTALFGGGNGLGCGLNFFGTNNVVFSTDAPFGPIQDTCQAVESLEIDETSREAIFHGNAEGLLRMQIA